ncbi:MAG: preprotein translocase subunit SecE [Clostridia bacterium]|nr:preprotein translocase subunit SecE [Clostridia bacterium]
MPEVENKPKKGFFQSMRAELKKVIWPSASQTAKSTGATIAFVLLIALILIVLNFAFQALDSLWWNTIIK